MAKLKFGFVLKDGKLLHIESVLNGKACGCVCPGCYDVLVAKNNCTKKENHFAHTSKHETSDCLMTQLHLAAQQYFLDKQVIDIPSGHIEYDNEKITFEARKIRVDNTYLEKSIDKFTADVVLETEIGTLIIEIAVTHFSSEEKKTYFKDNKIISLEYDLSERIENDVDESLELLKSNKIPSSWVYSWCHEEIINQFLLDKKELASQSRIQSVTLVNSLIKKTFESHTILLPRYTSRFEEMINGQMYRHDVEISNERELDFDIVELEDETENYCVLKIQKRGMDGTLHLLKVVFTFLEGLESKLPKLEGSVIINFPIVGTDCRLSKWLHAPELEGRVKDKFKKHRSSIICKGALKQKAENLRTTAECHSKKYQMNQDTFFKSDYGIWKEWMIKNHIFTPSSQNKNPKIPGILNYHRRFPSLWMFERWDILLISHLAEIIDELPTYTDIHYTNVFSKLAAIYPPGKEYAQLTSDPNVMEFIGRNQSSLLEGGSIKNALKVFEINQNISLKNNHFFRKTSLKKSLKL